MTGKKHRPVVGAANPRLIVERMCALCTPDLPDLGMEDRVGVAMGAIRPADLQALYREAAKELATWDRTEQGDRLLEAFRVRAALQ